MRLATSEAPLANVLIFLFRQLKFGKLKARARAGTLQKGAAQGQNSSLGSQNFSSIRNRELKQTTETTATRTPPNKRFNEQGRVVRMPANANQGIKVNRSINFSCLKMFFTACVLGSLRLFKLKTEG